MGCHYSSSILFFCNKMHLCFENVSRTLLELWESYSRSPQAGAALLPLLSVCTVSLHRLNKRARASQLTVLLGAALPRYSASAAETEAAGRQCFSLQSGERDKSFRWGFYSNMPRRCDHNPFFHSLCFQTKASACDRESDFLCSLFMQLNHDKTSKLIWHEWHAPFLEKWSWEINAHKDWPLKSQAGTCWI